MDELDRPLEAYKSLSDFFSRRLKSGVREISPIGLASPADGRILHFGEITSNSVEQVKGVQYSLSAFLGPNEILPTEKKRFYQIVLYLAPGDYHGFHSPVEMKVNTSRHFPGLKVAKKKGMVDVAQLMGKKIWLVQVICCQWLQ
jgi:phosphatidylserine decarboxylase